MKVTTIGLALTFMVSSSIIFAGGHLVGSTTDTQDVRWAADESPSGGKSHLTRTDGMVLITVEGYGLVPGDAHTLWWVVFNNPAGCNQNGCDGDDFTPDGIASAQIAVGNASGNVVKSDGTTEIGARLRRGDVDSGHQVLFGAGGDPDAPVLTASPHDAEVHVIVQSHGQARGGNNLSDQISYFEAHCTPACSDPQFAVHLP